MIIKQYQSNKYWKSLDYSHKSRIYENNPRIPDRIIILAIPDSCFGSILCEVSSTFTTFWLWRSCWLYRFCGRTQCSWSLIVFAMFWSRNYSWLRFGKRIGFIQQTFPFMRFVGPLHTFIIISTPDSDYENSFEFVKLCKYLDGSDQKNSVPAIFKRWRYC